MGFERNPMKSYRELDKPKLLLDKFRLFFQNKQNTRSDIGAVLCQFEWFHGIRKKSHEIVSRTRQAKTTSRYILLVFVKQTKHSKWHWSNTLSVLAISRDSKEIPWNRIENSTSLNYFSIHFACFFKTNKTLEVTLKQHFVSSSDGEATAESLYRELDKPRLTSRYILLVFVKQTKHSKWHWSNTLSVRVISLDSKEISWNRIENSINPVLLLDTFRLFL